MDDIIEAPPWFTRAVETDHREHTIQVCGAPIHFLHWPNKSAPGLLFVHGGGAHAHWWDFIAPLFMEHYNIAAIDLSGMGDSGHRDQYSGDVYAEELMAVIKYAELGPNPVIIGHSFGGMATLKAGVNYPDQLGGIMMVDTAVFPPGFNKNNDLSVSPFKERKIYPDRATALSRFRLVPPQSCHNRYMLDYIAEHSITRLDGGWSWKFDVRFLQKTIFDQLATEIKNLKCRAVVMYGERSILFGKFMLGQIHKLYPDNVPFIMIEDAQHHVFLDQPLRFAQQVHDQLLTWEHGQGLSRWIKETGELT